MEILNPVPDFNLSNLLPSVVSNEIDGSIDLKPYFALIGFLIVALLIALGWR